MTRWEVTFQYIPNEERVPSHELRRVIHVDAPTESSAVSRAWLQLQRIDRSAYPGSHFIYSVVAEGARRTAEREAK